jgi:hypothetical protein
MPTAPELYRELSLATQTAYAEVLDQARTAELDALAGLTGAFHRRSIKGRDYVNFGYEGDCVVDGARLHENAH